VLAGNPWNNSTAFPDSGTEVALDGDVKGYFRIMAPPNPDDGSDVHTPIGGVTDESAKINPNALMKIDPTGQQLHDMLVKLPNMTEDVANNIVAWMGGSVGIQNGGQTSYANYRVKNGPLDSIDELLLVQGVTADLLYGWDLNRNGFMDGKEADNGLGRGWAAYLTVHSREQTADPRTGVPYVALNGDDLNQLYSDLTTANVDVAVAKYIILARLYNGPLNPTPALKDWTQVDLQSYDISADLVKATTQSTSYKFKSLLELIGTEVPKAGNPMKKTPNVKYVSPLDPTGPDFAAKLADLFSKTTIYTTPEIPARINISTAPLAVLTTLPSFDDTDIAQIQQARMTADLTNPAWIFTEAKISPAKLMAMENLITTQTQVYRVQSIGSVGAKGPTVRMEAVIDTNGGRPRILAWRDMTELGKGLPQ
jgi:hypothetical protein